MQRNLSLKELAQVSGGEVGNYESNPIKLQVRRKRWMCLAPQSLSQIRTYLGSWKWVLQAITEVFHFWKSFEFQPIDPKE